MDQLFYFLSLAWRIIFSKNSLWGSRQILFQLERQLNCTLVLLFTQIMLRIMAEGTFVLSKINTILYDLEKTQLVDT